jgi:hypothetical protein
VCRYVALRGELQTRFNGRANAHRRSVSTRGTLISA